jgi:hypothetical protein
MNSDKSTILHAFNSNFFEFMNDISSLFPDNADIITAKKAFEMAKKANPTIIIKIWFSNIQQPYSSIIESGDISFFYDKDYASDLGGLTNSNEILKIIDTLRQPIKSMSDVNKQHSMNYIQILSKLSLVYSQL